MDEFCESKVQCHTIYWESDTLFLDWRLYAVMPETKEQYSDPRLVFPENQAA